MLHGGTNCCSEAALRIKMYISAIESWVHQQEVQNVIEPLPADTYVRLLDCGPWPGPWCPSSRDLCHSPSMPTALPPPPFPTSALATAPALQHARTAMGFCMVRGCDGIGLVYVHPNALSQPGVSSREHC